MKTDPTRVCISSFTSFLTTQEETVATPNLRYGRTKMRYHWKRITEVVIKAKKNVLKKNVSSLKHSILTAKKKNLPIHYTIYLQMNLDFIFCIFFKKYHFSPFFNFSQLFVDIICIEPNHFAFSVGAPTYLIYWSIKFQVWTNILKAM